MKKGLFGIIRNAMREYDTATSCTTLDGEPILSRQDYARAILSDGRVHCHSEHENDRVSYEPISGIFNRVMLAYLR